MTIKVNGNEQNLSEEKLSISELLVKNAVKAPEMVSVQLNGEFVKRESFPETFVKEKDEVDFMYFMGGGQ